MLLLLVPGRWLLRTGLLGLLVPLLLVAPLLRRRLLPLRRLLLTVLRQLPRRLLCIAASHLVLDCLLLLLLHELVIQASHSCQVVLQLLLLHRLQPWPLPLAPVSLSNHSIGLLLPCCCCSRQQACGDVAVPLTPEGRQTAAAPAGSITARLVWWLLLLLAGFKGLVKARHEAKAAELLQLHAGCCGSCLLMLQAAHHVGHVSSKPLLHLRQAQAKARGALLQVWHAAALASSSTAASAAGTPAATAAAASGETWV